jgi:hypothetical protein
VRGDRQCLAELHPNFLWFGLFRVGLVILIVGFLVQIVALGWKMSS